MQPQYRTMVAGCTLNTARSPKWKFRSKYKMTTPPSKTTSKMALSLLCLSWLANAQPGKRLWVLQEPNGIVEYDPNTFVLRSSHQARRAVPGISILRQPAHGRHAGGQPQTHPAADTHSEHRSALPETELEPPGARSRDLPVLATRRLHRAPVAQPEVRTHLPRRLRQRGRSIPSAGLLLPLLQSPAPTPGAQLPHAGRSVPAPIHKEKVIAMMVGSAPQTPRDLALFFFRMDGFCFSGLRSCRTLERLDRKTGQRRDAIRAPIQPRNGWRPHGRLLATPPHTLTDG